MQKRNLIRFDWAMKRLLRNKSSFGILEGFLSELLYEDIKIENILESEGNRETALNKTNQVDLLVKDSRGELIVIEIQNDYFQDYLLRMLFGTSKLIIDNMERGMGYNKIKKVISVNIVYFDLGHGEDYIYHGTTNFIGINKNDYLLLSKDEQLVYHTEKISRIYPEYYIIKVNEFDNIANNTLDEWIRFLKTEEIEEGTKAKGLKEAFEKLDVLKLSPADKADYEYFIKEWRDNYGRVVGNYNKGKYEGHLEGKEEGKNERNIEVAKNCLELGMSISTIALITGLTEEEILQLKSS